MTIDYPIRYRIVSTSKCAARWTKKGRQALRMLCFMKIMTTIQKSVSSSTMDSEGARKALERTENGKQVEQAQSIVKAPAANQANSKENGQIDFDNLSIALSSDVKYCGGAKNSGAKTAHDIMLPSYEGLRLYNPGNNCYIHAALNSILTNPHIMAEIDYAFQLPGMPPFFSGN